jgi:predicted acylesterase/phospholipase RssA
MMEEMPMQTSSFREPQGRLGFVLSGGGARGPFQVGVYERLLHDPRFSDGPAVLSGTSSGALNSAMIAAGLSPGEMMEFWYSLADDPPVVANAKLFRSAYSTMISLFFRELARLPMRLPGDLLRLAQRSRFYWPPGPGSASALFLDFLLTSRFDLLSEFLDGIEEPFVLDASRMRERLVSTFGDTRIQTGRRLAINALDSHTGKVVRYVTGPVPALPSSEYVVVPAITVDMLMASASIPLLFSPTAIGERLLWDGGLLVNTPLAPAVSLGSDRVVSVLVTERHHWSGPLTRLGRAIELTADAFLENAYNVDRMLLLERNRLAHLEGNRYREVTLYEAVHPAHDRNLFKAGSFLDFRRSTMKAMYRAGQRAAADWLTQGPPIDRLDSRREDPGRRIA